MSQRVLVVEDDQVIATNLCRALDAAGYLAECAGSLDEARRRLEANDEAGAATVELVLLDRGLPDGDGVDLCRELAACPDAPRVILLTARADEIDVVMGLDSGAVDYVAKPFRLAELLARVRAHLRVPADVEAVAVGNLRVDAASRRCWLGDEELLLRTKEFDLLLALAENAGVAVAREQLMSDVWDEHWFGSTKTLDVHISTLRRKMEHDAEAPVISTIRNFGYRLDAP